jgi:hypothetical protein
MRHGASVVCSSLIISASTTSTATATTATARSVATIVISCITLRRFDHDALAGNRLAVRCGFIRDVRCLCTGRRLTVNDSTFTTTSAPATATTTTAALAALSLIRTSGTLSLRRMFDPWCSGRLRLEDRSYTSNVLRSHRRHVALDIHSIKRSASLDDLA